MDVAVIGLGYVGIPLALALSRAGVRVVGLDVDEDRVRILSRGSSPIRHIPTEAIRDAIDSGFLFISTDFSLVTSVDALIICVPTPITADKSPDLAPLRICAQTLSPHIRRGHIVILESTSWPGTTRDVLAPLLEMGGLKVNVDFDVAFAPEREDPGNLRFSARNTPKIVGAESQGAAHRAKTIYDKICDNVIIVGSTRVAESAKLVENIFRSVNIALVNELQQFFADQDIDIWDVLSAAETKPFGYMRFNPGPGVGGHCIPVDPYYLTSKAREHGTPLFLVETATAINDMRPTYIVSRITYLLGERLMKSVKGSNIVLFGMSYKKNIDDLRESPAVIIASHLHRLGANVFYYDKYVRAELIKHALPNINCISDLEVAMSISVDIAVVTTDHDDVDYSALSRFSSVVLDVRNALGSRGIYADNVVRS